MNHTLEDKSNLVMGAQFIECAACGHVKAEHFATFGIGSGCHYHETRYFKGRSVTARCPCPGFDYPKEANALSCNV